MRKAYLCNSVIRTLRPGSNLLFYRSRDIRAVTSLGVVESTLVTRHAVDVARFVGNRTVYSFDQIGRLCSQMVLAILFRQARILRKPITLAELMGNGLLRAAPSLRFPPVRHSGWSRVCARSVRSA
jgi:hypothetical protein